MVFSTSIINIDILQNSWQYDGWNEMTFEKISVIYNDFEFHSGHSLSITSVEILKKCVANLTIKYGLRYRLRNN